MSIKKVYSLANIVIGISFVMMVVGAYVGFVDHDAFTLTQQVIAHISIMVGAGLLKLSYVMRLNASMHLRINDFSHLEREMPGEVELH